MSRRLARLWAKGGAILALAAVSACAPTYRNHGYVPLDEDLSQIVVGVDTRATVEDLVGPPSSTGVLNEDGFFYIRSRVRTFGPRKPQVIDRQILAISFSQDGIVENIERFGLEDGRVITLSRRVTDSGTNPNFIQALLRNLGRFDPSAVLGNQ